MDIGILELACLGKGKSGERQFLPAEPLTKKRDSNHSESLLNTGSPPRESNTAPTDYESKAYVDGTPQSLMRRGPLAMHKVR